MLLNYGFQAQRKVLIDENTLTINFTFAYEANDVEIIHIGLIFYNLVQEFIYICVLGYLTMVQFCR